MIFASELDALIFMVNSRPFSPGYLISIKITSGSKADRAFNASLPSRASLKVIEGYLELKRLLKA
jgi:hypothetical protein